MWLSIMYYLFPLLLFVYYVRYGYPRCCSISTSESASINNHVEELGMDKFYYHPIWPER
jgi:hypothetical protein